MPNASARRPTVGRSVKAREASAARLPLLTKLFAARVHHVLYASPSMPTSVLVLCTSPVLLS